MNIRYSMSVVAVAASFVLISLPVAAFAAGPAGVNLGTASSFAILAKTGISSTGITSVVGDIGVSPAAASYITGFALTLPAAGASATSALVTGSVYASDYAVPTPSNLTTAVLDMQTAYTDAMGRAPTVTELGAGTIGGLTLAPGTYKWGTGVTIPTDVTLSGGTNDVWIFQIAQTLTVSSAVHVILSGGAQAGNVFWVVAGQTTIGTTAVFSGTILDQTAIVLNTGARLQGRALAQTAVTLDSNTVVRPSAGSVTPTPTPTPAPAQTPVPAQSPSTNPTPSSVSGQAGSSQTGSSSAVTPTLTFQQQQQYNLLISAGASQSAALNAVYQMPSQTPAVASSASVFGRHIRTITVNLVEGSRGNDVITLQQFLMSQHRGTHAQTLSAVGATGYFGPLTRAALAEFQAQTGIAPALGNFGPITRGYISIHY